MPIDKQKVIDLVRDTVFDGNGPINEDKLTELIDYIYKQGVRDGYNADNIDEL